MSRMSFTVSETGAGSAGSWSGSASWKVAGCSRSTPDLARQDVAGARGLAERVARKVAAAVGGCGKQRAQRGDARLHRLCPGTRLAEDGVTPARHAPTDRQGKG